MLITLNNLALVYHLLLLITEGGDANYINVKVSETFSQLTAYFCKTFPYRGPIFWHKLAVITHCLTRKQSFQTFQLRHLDYMCII
jgi:hypothetical protein